jgi:cardiolipin synthase A/B
MSRAAISASATGWLRHCAVAACLAWVSGCLSYPNVASPSQTPAGQPVRVSGAKGPLSAKDSAAIIDELKRKSGNPDILARHIALEEAIAGTPLVAGNRTTLLEDGPATYKSMFEAIRNARDHINLETYIFEDDEVGQRFADALIEKQSRGVQVNIIYDSLGSVKAPSEFFDRLRKAGIRVLEFGPLNPLASRKAYEVNHRDHRKILVVDGRIAFVGGLNISSVYASSPSSGRRAVPRDGKGESKDARQSKDPKSIPWRDTHVRIEGPVVRDFQKLFLETWEKQKGEPLPKRNYYPSAQNVGNHVVRAIGSSADEEYSAIYVTLVSAFANAERSIDITIAYFLPDEQLLGAITDAAKRGVKVRMVMPSQSDFWAVFHAGRSRYEDLLRAGVKVYERKDSLLHAKTIVIDEVWSTVGSTNLDPRSFLHNDEVNAVVLGYDFARDMLAMFQRDIGQSREITAEDWRQRPVGDRMREWAARIWEYWM